jgi:hypothetical protein
MQKVSVRTTIKNKRIQEHRNIIEDAIEMFEGKQVLVTIERYFKRRTNKQNRYYWGVIVEIWKGILREEWGEVLSADDVHSFLKSNLNFESVVDFETGELMTNPINGEVIRKPKSTAENTTKSQENYHEACRQLAWEMFKVIIPLPNEDLTEAIDV